MPNQAEGELNMEMNYGDTPIVETEIQEDVQEVTEMEETPSEIDEQIEQEDIQEQQQEVKPFNFELQYNKEKVVIDNEDKLRELAQKGMNYEKVQNKLHEFENDPLRRWAYEYMKENNFEDPNDFLNAVKADREQRAIQSKINELIENEGFTEAQARRIAEAEAKAEKVNQRFSDMENQNKQQKEYADFLSWHDSMHKKGVFKDASHEINVPAEVWEQVAQGVPLKTAYMEHQLVNLKTNTEQEVIKSIQKNAATSPGKINENASTEDKPWSNEYIEAMAQKYGKKWVSENYEKIQNSGYYK